MNKRILWLCFLLTSFFAQAQPIVWDGKKDWMNIGQNVYYLEDPTGQLTIDQVSAEPLLGRFAKSNQVILNFGITKSVYWLKVSVDNRTQQTLWLDVAQPYLPAVDLYARDSAGRWQVHRAGYRVNLNKKEIRHIDQVFPLNRNTEPIYVRLLSYQHPIPIKIWNAQAFGTKTDKQNINYGIYVGILLFMIINNLFLFFALRRFAYFHYSVQVFLHILISACVMDGYILYLFPDTDLLYWYILIPIVDMINTVLYGILFLDVRKYTPTLYRVSVISIMYLVGYLIIYRFLPIMTVFPLNQIHALLTLALALTMGIQTARRGNKIGYYFALAYCLYFLIVIVETMYIKTGKPSYIFDVSYVSIAIFLEVFVLSYALSKRFEWERKEIQKSRAEAQQLLLEKTRENERILLLQNETLEREVAERTNAIGQKSRELQESLDELKATQTQLIHREKMASLGELTAGIAHEIQNPLNFVNNFSELSAELIEELNEEVAAGRQREVQSLTDTLNFNLQKIKTHGQRAASIVQGMLEQSRNGIGEKQRTNLNALADEYLRLAYHGQRAKDKSFNATLTTQFDDRLPEINLVPQDMGRVLLNIYSNAFYAVHEKSQRMLGNATTVQTYQPQVWVQTRVVGKNAELRIKDNGIGIPAELLNKIYQPFFTTKPTGQGTGLGLYLSYDIITKGHGGQLQVRTERGEYTEMIIYLPMS